MWAAKRRRFVHAADPEARGYLLAVIFEARPVGRAVGPSSGDTDDDEEIFAARWIDPDEVEREVLPLATDRRAYVP